MAIHGLQRLQQRYDHEMTLADLQAIERIIAEGGAKFVREMECSGRAIYLVPFDGGRIKVVAHIITNRVITALPLKGREVKKNHRVYRKGQRIKGHH